MPNTPKRHFVDGEYGNSPNGKRQCFENQPLIEIYHDGVENRHAAAALVADPVNEDESMRFMNTDVAQVSVTSNGHTCQSSTDRVCVDHNKDCAINTSVRAVDGGIPLQLPQPKGARPVSVDDNKEDQSSIQRKQGDINRSCSNQNSSQSSVSNEGINEDEQSSSSSSESSSSSDSSEESSLLSSWSDESAEEGEEQLPSMNILSEYEGLQRLEKKLELRKKRLKRLCAGQPPAYVQLLENNEERAGRLKIAEYKEQHPEENSNENECNNSTIPMPTSTILSTFQGILQFEWLHTVPCAYVVFIVCLGHSVFYSLVECLCRIFYQSCLELFIPESMFYGILIAVGFLLLRINGSLFFYSSTTRDYIRIKMEMSNRLKVGMLDARLFKRIKGTITDSSFTMFGYYLNSIGINYFYYKYHSKWMSQHLNWFESIWSRATELLNSGIIDDKNEWERFFLLDTNPYATYEQISPSCESAADVVSYPVLRSLYYFWCNDFTSEYKSVELTFHGLSFLIVTGLTFRVGMNMMKLCD